MPSAKPIPVGRRDLNVHIVVDGSIQKVGTSCACTCGLGARPMARPSLGQARRRSRGFIPFAGFHQRGHPENHWAQAPAKWQRAGGPPPRIQSPTNFTCAADRLLRLNSWDNRAAIDMLETPPKLDPNFADAWRAGGSSHACWDDIERVATTGCATPKKPAQSHRGWIPIMRRLTARKAAFSGPPARKFKMARLCAPPRLRLNPGCHPARVWQF